MAYSCDVKYYSAIKNNIYLGVLIWEMTMTY